MIAEQPSNLGSMMSGAGSTIARGPAPRLTSDRLNLMPVGEQHAAAITDLIGDIAVARWLSRVPHPYTHDDATFFIRNIAPRELAWAIELLDGRLVGVGGFAFRQNGDVELGYWLGQPFWGQGIATEAGRVLLEYAWRCGTPHVYSGCFDGNAQSLNVLHKLGFREGGRTTRFSQVQGAELDHIDVFIQNPNR